MKTIQPYWAPQGEAREQPVAQATGTTGNRRMAGFAAAALLAITALNLGATAYLAGAIAELRGAEDRLAKLSTFEKRIMERLEIVNNGVQSQFDNLLQVTDGRMAELRRDLEIARGQATVEATGSIDETATITEVESSPAVEIEAADTSLLQPDAAPRPQRRQAPPPPNPAYQRIEGPNGKVTYRKLQ